MKGLIQEIKFGEGGKVLTVICYDPWPPYRPDGGFRTEEEATDYNHALKEYEEAKDNWEKLRLGNITFQYVVD